MSELLFCPFCGGEAETLTAESMYGGYLFGIMCNDCRSRGDVYDTEAEAIAAWNSRAAMEFDNWFYLPKPKEPIAEVTGTTHAWDGTKVKTDVFYQVQEQAAINWAKELDEHIIKRICEVWNSRADYHGYEQAAIEAWESVKAWNTRTDDYKRAAEYWQRMYEQTFAERTCHDTGENEWHFVCSACGYEQNGYEFWNYCPNCGARVKDVDE